MSKTVSRCLGPRKSLSDRVSPSIGVSTSNKSKCAPDSTTPLTDDTSDKEHDPTFRIATYSCALLPRMEYFVLRTSMHTAPAKTQAQQALPTTTLALVDSPLLSTPPHDHQSPTPWPHADSTEKKGAGQRPNARQDDNAGGRDARRGLASVDRYMRRAISRSREGGKFLACVWCDKQKTWHHSMTLSCCLSYNIVEACQEYIWIASVFLFFDAGRQDRMF